MNISVETFGNTEVKGWWQGMFADGQLITNTIFQSWEWNFYWWKIYAEHDRSKELFLLVLRDEKLIQAVAPFYIQKRRMFKKNLWQKILWIATDSSDYPDLVTTSENLDFKWQCILEYLHKTFPTVWLECWDVLPESSIAQHRKRKKDFDYFVDGGSTYLHTSLPDNEEAFEQQLGKNLIRKLHQSERQLGKRGVVTHNIHWQYDPQASDALRRMNIGKFHQGSFFSHTDHLHFYDAFSRDPCFAKKCFYSTLKLDGSIISVLMGFHHANRLCYYLSGYDRKYAAMSPSSLNIFYFMRKAIGERWKVFDFLRGKEQYKYRWNVEEMRSQTWTIVPKKMISKYHLAETIRKSHTILRRLSN